MKPQKLQMTKSAVLDDYMKSYIQSKGLLKHSIKTVPVWPVLTQSYDGNRNENPFKIEQNFGDKIVIMYSGNHSFVHTLDTLLESAEQLKNNPNFLFVFIGEGTQKNKVTEFKQRCQNIIQLPYQPKENIHLSLSILTPLKK
jgi:colanic acid biosynthesis glycosyl transferase WcaI